LPAALEATEEENSVQINSVKFPAISSPTEANNKLSVNENREEPKIIAIYQP